eukprot:scaffold95799_cov35-Prasinocladus_malaysianus.AAC.1
MHQAGPVAKPSGAGQLIAYASRYLELSGLDDGVGCLLLEAAAFLLGGFQLVFLHTTARTAGRSNRLRDELNRSRTKNTHILNACQAMCNPSFVRT